MAEPHAVSHAFLNDFDAWGPVFWKFAHAITFDYPEAEPSTEDRERAQKFFAMLPWFLPCGVCGAHFIATVREKHPFTAATLQNRESLARWLVDVHNTVNRRLNKPEVSYEDANRYYNVDCRTPLRVTERVCPAEQRDGLMVALIVAVVLLVVAGVACGLGWSRVHSRA